MPASYVIDILDRIVRMRAWGVYTNADLRDYYHAIVADVRFRPGFQCLVNVEAVKVFALDSAVIAEVASWAVFRPGIRRAVVAPSDVAFGLARMFSIHAESAGQNVAVFRTELAAEVWLSSPVDAGEETLPFMRVA